MRLFNVTLLLLTVAAAPLQAKSFSSVKMDQPKLVPHKALYDIDLVATRSGSQIANIGGKMYYEWKPSCDAWVTDHRFSLNYEYSDSPAMRIASDFATLETFDGEQFNFSARRSRDKNLYEELRGVASIGDEKGQVKYTLPEDLKFTLTKDTMFPMRHTVELAKRLHSGGKFFPATVFDGSDDEGPVEINTFIGNPVNAMKILEGSDKIDMTLVNTLAWNVRMAVFPAESDISTSDYEMNMVFHDNGVISDMLIEYGDFSVTQKLVALERIEGDECGEGRSPIESQLENQEK